jgi:prevent-host-death family protein
MIKVGAYEAKTHLPRLLAKVQQGERVTITKHGVPIAELVPVAGARTMSVQEAIAGLKEFRKGHSLDGITIRELIEEGRE